MKSKKSLIMLAIIIVISLFGIAYAYFEYYGLGANQKIVAGKVNLILNEGKDTIDINNVFPETKEMARSEGRTDNAITFTISGINTTKNKDIWYEIMLSEGDSEEGMTRFNPKDLVFDLVEMNADGTEGTYLVDALSYNDFNERRIWVNTVLRETSLTVDKTYKLRMWLSDRVLISDTDPTADYPATDYENHYASVKVSVYGDFIEKSIPYNYLMASPWRSGDIYSQRSNITEIHFVSMEKSEIDTRYDASTIKKDVTDTKKSNGGSVKAWLEPNSNDETKYIMYVASDGTTFFPSSCYQMFYNWSTVKSISFENVNTKYVTSMSQMFRSCSGLISLEIGNWDTSGVSDMSNMFQSCSGLTSLEIGNWDTSGVTTMAGMFYSCKGLTSLEIGNWDTSGVSDMSNMFNSCSKLTSLEISNWDTGGVSTMTYMFSSCSGLTSLDIGNWDTSGVSTMTYMFNGCSGLTSLEIGNWDISGVTTMAGMFYSCKGLTSLDLNDWDTSGVSSIGSMFSFCSGLTSLEIGNWDTSGVSSLHGMFMNCSSLTSLDLNDWDTSGVSDMSDMFNSCSKLTSLEISNWDTSGVTDMSFMFRNCISLTSLDISNFTFDSVTSYSYIFNSMKARTDTIPTIIVKSETEQNWILELTSPNNRPSSWTTDNVIIKTSM